MSLVKIGQSQAKEALSMSEADTRKIIHVDVDAFYASVEQRN